MINSAGYSSSGAEFDRALRTSLGAVGTFELKITTSSGSGVGAAVAASGAAALTDSQCGMSVEDASVGEPRRDGHLVAEENRKRKLRTEETLGDRRFKLWETRE